MLTLAAHGVLDEIKTGELRQKTSAFVRQFRTDPSGVMDEIRLPAAQPRTGADHPERLERICREAMPMPSTKLLKERIESIQDTMKITNAMYLISSSSCARHAKITRQFRLALSACR